MFRRITISQRENSAQVMEVGDHPLAEKVSFGSDAGAKTKETLMTVLKTLKLRTKNDVRIAFANFPDQFAENPNIGVYEALFSK